MSKARRRPGLVELRKCISIAQFTKLESFWLTPAFRLEFDAREQIDVQNRRFTYFLHRSSSDETLSYIHSGTFTSNSFFHGPGDLQFQRNFDARRHIKLLGNLLRLVGRPTKLFTCISLLFQVVALTESSCVSA